MRQFLFTISSGQSDPELPASAAVRPSSSDADHLHRPPLLPFLCGSPVHGCIHCLEVRGCDLFRPYITLTHNQMQTTIFNTSCNPRSHFIRLSLLLCSLTPSEECGPFRRLNNTFSVVGLWIDELEVISSSHWVVWIYQNIIRSEIFYFFITLIIL